MIIYLRQWLICLKHYVLMCVFASSPDRLPYNATCTLITISGYLLLGFTLVDEERSYATIAAQVLFELALLASIAYAGLKWQKKLGRFSQTFSALVGINLVISAVTLPLFHLMSDGANHDEAIQTNLLYLTMIMAFWILAVLTHILKRAFEVNTVMSALIAFNYFIVYQFSLVWIN